jgi:hypothetical protein
MVRDVVWYNVIFNDVVWGMQYAVTSAMIYGMVDDVMRGYR